MREGALNDVCGQRNLAGRLEMVLNGVRWRHCALHARVSSLRLFARRICGLWCFVRLLRLGRFALCCVANDY